MAKNKRIIKVSDKMQKEYRYELTKPIGKVFNLDFKPELTPKQMLSLGVFGGRYLRDCRNEFPRDWFDKAKLHPEGKPANSPKLNFFGVNASQPLSVWLKKGWIHPDDPRGWFQWYCRYFMGRRHEDDQRQIRRWKGIKRHIVQIKNNCLPKDWNCRIKQRQAVLHWAYDSRKI